MDNLRGWALVIILAILLLLAITLGWGWHWVGGVGPMYAGAQGDDPMPCYDVQLNGTWWHFCGIKITNTPAPPVATSTPLPYPTPTVEIAPTATPSSTPTPSATPDTTCRAVTTVNLNVRELPSYTWLKVLLTGTSIEPVNTYIYNGARWYGHYIPDDDAEFGFVLGYSHGDYLTLSGDCSLLPDATPEVQRSVAQGPHCLLGRGCEVAANYARAQSAFKVLDGSWDLGAQAKQANPDLWLLCRSFLWDSIGPDTGYNARAAWDTVKGSIPAFCDAFEMENEHTPQTDADWQRWSAFSIGVAQLAQAERNLQYCAFSLGPGWPALGEFVYLYEYIAWVAANPLPDGRYHCIAAHASPYAPWSRSDMPWVNDPYIAGRWYKANVIYKAKYGYDLADWPGVLAITEIGLSGGYSGDWNAPYTCGEVASAYWHTVATYQERGYPHALLWWSFGKIGMWVSDHDCADEIWG